MIGTWCYCYHCLRVFVGSTMVFPVTFKPLSLLFQSYESLNSSFFVDRCPIGFIFLVRMIIRLLASERGVIRGHMHWGR